MSIQLSKFNTILTEKESIVNVLALNAFKVKSLILLISPQYYVDLMNSEDMRKFIPNVLDDFELMGMEKIITTGVSSFKIYVELEKP